MNKNIRRFALTALAALLLIPPAGSMAQPVEAPVEPWPTRPLRLVVPMPAGSSADIVARSIAEHLGQRLGETVVVENRPGASGSLGISQVAKSAPDGYTFGLGTASTLAVATLLSENLPYDPLKDFTPLGLIGGAPYVLVVPNDVPATNVKQLIALAKAKPGHLNYGSSGLYSTANLATQFFAGLTDIELTHVPYKSASQSITDMVTGRIQVQFSTIATTLASIEAGQLRALATTGNQRVDLLSNVPTVIESGVPGYEAALWMAFVLPAGVPAPIADKLNAALNETLKGPARPALLRAGLIPEPGPRQAVTERSRSEIAKWRAVAEKAGILKPPR